MRSKFLVLLTLLLILNGCSPVIIANSSDEQPTPEIEILSPTSLPFAGYQSVQVEQVQVQFGVGSPIPVQVSVTGNLPDTCAQIELVEQQQEGSHFEIIMSTVPANAEGCVPDTIPFRMTIPLNITNLPAGLYTVQVNGVGANFRLETDNTTSSQPTAGTVVGQDDIPVASVHVEVGAGSPIPVHAVVGLNLPNSCAQLGEIRLDREGNTFYARLIAHIAGRADCREDSIPFLLEIPLNIVGLPEGPYEVNVNGVTTGFDPRATPAAPANLKDFENQLQTALTRRDPAAIQALMGERFIVAYWQSEGESIPSEQAVTQLLSGHVAVNSVMEFHEFQDIPAFTPQSFVGPDVELAKTIYVTGWGADGQSQALLFVSRRPDGALFWQGVLVTPEGFASPTGQACSQAVAVRVMDGQASYNGISFTIDPSLDYGLTARSCSATTAGEQQLVREAHPPYTEFFFSAYSRGNIDSQPHIRVYEVTGDLENYLYPINSLDDLKLAVEQRPEPVTWFQHSPLHTRQAYLDFANGTGIRGLIQYMQDFFFFTNNGLIYEFNGLTRDGRHFVSVRYPVSVPFLMELKGATLPPNNINPGAIVIPAWPDDFKLQRQVIEAYNDEAFRRFEQMSDRDVFPDLALLDRLVLSIRVSQP